MFKFVVNAVWWIGYNGYGKSRSRVSRKSCKFAWVNEKRKEGKTKPINEENRLREKIKSLGLEWGKLEAINQHQFSIFSLYIIYICINAKQCSSIVNYHSFSVLLNTRTYISFKRKISDARSNSDEYESNLIICSLLECLSIERLCMHLMLNCLFSLFALKIINKFKLFESLNVEMRKICYLGFITWSQPLNLLEDNFTEYADLHVKRAHTHATAFVWYKMRVLRI